MIDTQDDSTIEHRAYQALRDEMSIYIAGENVFVEVSYIAFPRFTGSHLCYFSLIPSQREILDRDFEKAQELAKVLPAGLSNAAILQRFRELPDKSPIQVNDQLRAAIA